MSLEVGSRLAHYDVTALIGEGGMGRVYQATDTKLKRQVALKILPEAFAADPERLTRFQREAEVLASLNHPNIAAIYGLEEAEGVRALVLELVEGPTLADRIKQGPISLDEALPIAKQIAEALEAAHEKGIIHRDLKPANIKVKEDGTVKVLDFGLAKALNPLPEGDASQSPTLTAMATQMGVIMGTAAYMSPEQARGKTVDKRADVWAFGAVLFEMLTGKRAFGGGGVSETLARVIEREPDYGALPPNVPEPIRRLLRRSLAKDRRRRLSDIADTRLEIDEAISEPSAQVAPVSAQSKAWWQALPLALGISAAALIITGLALWGLMRDTSLGPRSPARFAINLPMSDQLDRWAGGYSFALSPDGETLVYVASRDGVQQLYRRALDQLEAVPISGTERAHSPFSPLTARRSGSWWTARSGDWHLLADRQLPFGTEPGLRPRRAGV